MQHREEPKIFLHDQLIDIMLISETHFTDKSFLKIPDYNLYHTNHPDNTADAGSAVLIKNSIDHYQLNGY
jgi:hypothetical protein